MKIDLITEGLVNLMKTNFYSDVTISSYLSFWKKLKNYLITNYQSEDYSPSLGFEYLKKINLISKDKLTVYDIQKIRMIHLLDDYMLHGVITNRITASKNPIVLKDDFLKIYTNYEIFINNTELSNSTKNHYLSTAKIFLDYLNQRDFEDLSKLSFNDVNKYISTFINYSFKTVELNICGLRHFLRYLNFVDILVDDIAGDIVMPKISKKTKIPSVWKEEELKLMLEAIDRNSPTGKRDYAMIIIACVLGLRIGDIKNLRFSNIDWKDNKISLVQSKTKKPLTLPLPKAVGWAIIDYVKNGRPNYREDDHIFIKHLPPFDYFKDNSHLQERIKHYCNKAGIYTGLNHKKGFHSLRHTAASMMLENGAKLPVITEILGHSNVDITSIYLKTDISHLRECVLDLSFED